MKVLVLGAGGMLGHTVLRLFSQTRDYEVFGSVRSESSLRLLPSDLSGRILAGFDVENHDNLIKLFSKVRPDVVINCVGLVKQLAAADDPLSALPINSILPHRLAYLCQASGARLIHISTDCVFSGKKGGYTELDVSDAADLYGRSKSIGEVNTTNALTIRTSIIGHELVGAHGLLSWFLAQKQQVRGFRRAIFSGLPTIELAHVIRDFVLTRPELSGLYHVSAAPINKYELLKLISKVYGKNTSIVPDDDLIIDRSLDSSRFQVETGYRPAPWPELIARMFEFG